MITRRDFVSAAALGAVGGSIAAKAAITNPAPAPQQQQRAARLPIIVSAGNGYPYLDRAYQQLNGGADTLESAISVVRGP